MPAIIHPALTRRKEVMDIVCKVLALLYNGNRAQDSQIRTESMWPYTSALGARSPLMIRQEIN